MSPSMYMIQFPVRLFVEGPQKRWLPQISRGLKLMESFRRVRTPGWVRNISDSYLTTLLSGQNPIKPESIVQQYTEES